MKFPSTITLTRVELAPSPILLQHASKITEVEWVAARFLYELVSMCPEQLLGQGPDAPAWQCTQVRFHRHTIYVRESRDEIRAMIEALPDEDEQKPAEPTTEDKVVCKECSAEFNRGAAVTLTKDPPFHTCPSCGCRVHLSPPNPGQEEASGSRLICVECSAEYDPSEVAPGGEVVFVCPSCSGRLTVMTAKA